MTMTQITRLLSLVFIITLAACATPPTKDIEIEADSDPKARLSGYKTYAWLATAQIMFDPEGQWEPRNVDIDAEVQLMINRELHNRGITEVASNPDMLVAYAAGIDMTALELKENPETKKKLLENVPKAALIIALIDADTGYVIWLGQATGNVQQQADESMVRARIEYAVREMFRLLPES
jgi:hypothetical protein